LIVEKPTAAEKVDDYDRWLGRVVKQLKAGGASKFRNGL
jgi:hypothetical protein